MLQLEDTFPSNPLEPMSLQVPCSPRAPESIDEISWLLTGWVTLRAGLTS